MVDFEEIRTRDTVTVGEYNVVTAGLQYGLVENSAFAKAVIRLPDMADFQLQLIACCGEQIGRFAAAAIIGYQQLEIFMSLRRKAPQDLLQPSGRIVGTGNDRQFQS